jgi:hypothetical protein
MTRWLRATVLGAALVVATALPAGVQAADDPSVNVDRTGTAEGEELVVTGTGWQPGTLITVELCGNAGRSGSVDCDVANGRVVTASAEGTFSTALIAGKPPRPCPCVLLADSQSTAESATSEIAVAGMFTVPLEQQATTAELRRELEIAGVRVDGRGPWQSWFGAAPSRQLVVTLHNSGDVPLRDPPLAIAVGSGDDPDRIIPAPAVGRLEPGQVRILEIPFELDSLTIGSRTVRVEVLGFPEPIVAEASTSAYPWGLLVLAVVLVQVVLLLVRNRLRRRIERDVGKHAAPSAMEVPIRTGLDEPADGLEQWSTGVVEEDPEPASPSIVAGPPPPLEAAPEPPALTVDDGAPLALEAGDDQLGPAVLAGSVLAATGPGATPTHPGDLERILDEHRRATAELAAWVVTNVITEGDAARDDLEACRSEASIALRRAHELAEALVAASGVRADELARAAEERDAGATRRNHEARALLADAQARADELMAAAEVAARSLEEQAREERERARGVFAAAQAESAELVDTARQELAALLGGLDARIAKAEESTQDTLRALLAAASAERIGWQRHRTTAPAPDVDPVDGEDGEAGGADVLFLPAVGEDRGSVPRPQRT